MARVLIGEVAWDAGREARREVRSGEDAVMGARSSTNPLAWTRTGAGAHRAPRWLGSGLLCVCDLFILGMAFLAATAAWMSLRPGIPGEIYAGHSPVLLCFPVVYWLNGLYKGFGLSSVDELRKSVTATTVGFLALIAASFLVKESALYSRGITALAWGIAVCAQPIARYAAKQWLSRKRWYGCEAVLLGSAGLTDRIETALKRHPELGLHVMRRMELGDDMEQWKGGVPQLPGLKPLGSEDVRACIVAVSGWEGSATSRLVAALTRVFPHVIVVPDLSSVPSLWVAATDLRGLVGIEMRDNLRRRSSQVIKRVVDLALCGLSAVPAGVTVMLLAAAVKMTSRGPVFYSQVRLGKGGRQFRVYKFRTMAESAGEILAECLRKEPRLADEWMRTQKLRKDPRLTVIGGLLRRTSLDELPQLWNVIKGEMSLVGPRPIVEEEIGRFGESISMYRRVTPGISGLWQVSGRSTTTYDERVELDSYYVRNWSLWMDVHILIKTVWIVLRGEGAY